VKLILREWKKIKFDAYPDLGVGGSAVVCTDTALYFSSLPSIISSTSLAFSRDTLEAKTCWLRPGREIVEKRWVGKAIQLT